MEFIVDDLDDIISKLSQEEASIGIQNKDCPSISTIQRDQNTNMITDNNSMCDGQYCLIIFNNPRWSQRLRSKQTRPQVINNGVKLNLNNF